VNPRKVLILYGTSYGQTAKIATRLSTALMDRGHYVTLLNAANVTHTLSLTPFDAIVLGSSIIARGHQKPVERFIKDHVHLLNEVPSAFFSVSASAGSAQPEGRAAADRVRDEFLKRVGWQPRLRASIAGAINYTRYNVLLRWYMKRASAKGGGSTDTTRDHEYTDWTQVQQFAHEIANLLDARLPVLREPQDLRVAEPQVQG
jgi:menaquinone-dependent protoporphyrinogen oxidase